MFSVFPFVLVMGTDGTDTAQAGSYYPSSSVGSLEFCGTNFKILFAVILSFSHETLRKKGHE